MNWEFKVQSSKFKVCMNLANPDLEAKAITKRHFRPQPADSKALPIGVLFEL